MWCAVFILAVTLAPPVAATTQAAPPQATSTPATPRILLDAAPRAVEYQLGRLSNDELARVERKEGDVRYRPVYLALLTRKGLGREYFDEALTALTALDKSTPGRVLLAALAKVGADDAATSSRLLQVLFAQPAEALRKERAAFAAAAEAAGPPLVSRGAYGALMIGDGSPKPAWELAAKRDGHLIELLRSIPSLGNVVDLRAMLFEPVAALLTPTVDAATREAALSALGWARADAATFRLLAHEVLQSDDGRMRAAAVRSLQALPKSAWPAEDVEPVARALVSQIGKLPAAERTEAAAVDAMQLAEALVGALADDSRGTLTRDLRALGVRIVRIETLPEQMMFDRKWFVAEAGKPVQIVLYNPDAMAHNLLVTAPGALKEVGTLASTMPVPSDPKAKPYVPQSPLVLQATRLLAWGESERLNFVAPKAAGEYVYVCTFPGHWVRMYGVMLVVESLDAWEQTRTPPKDPMTGQPYAAEK